jgi:GTP-binding protein
MLNSNFFKNSFKTLKSVNACSFPQNPIVAFIGRSNVGKSTLLNTLAQQNLSPSNKQPGCTKQVTWFAMRNHLLYMMDLPGYGYAVGMHLTKMFEQLIKQIVRQTTPATTYLWCIDSRAGITKADAYFWKHFLKSYASQLVLTFTKCDQVSRSHRAQLERNVLPLLPGLQSVVSVGRHMKVDGLYHIIGRHLASVTHDF